MEMLTYIDEIVQVDDLEDRDVLIELIEHLDGLFLAAVREKQEQERRDQASNISAPRAASPRPPRPR